MKRFFKRFIAVTTALICLLLLSGCNQKVILEFNNNFYGSANDPSIGYSETLVYEVKCAPDYTNLKKDTITLPSYSLKYGYEGTYTSTLNVGSLNSPAIDFPPNNSTDFNDDQTKIIFYLKTELNLTSTYKVDGKKAEGYTENDDGTISYEEYVTSQVWFMRKGLSFAPILSIVSQKSTAIELGEVANISLQESSNRIDYTNENYQVDITVGETNQTDSYDYTFRTAIDNAQLLFAIRSLEIAEEASVNLPVISPVYGEVQTLTVTNSTENSKSAKINGVETQIPVKNINFKLSAKYNTGLPHYAFIQKNGNDTQIPNKALIIEYAAPISTRGNICNLGAMVYTLTSATY